MPAASGRGRCSRGWLFCYDTVGYFGDIGLTSAHRSQLQGFPMSSSFYHPSVCVTGYWGHHFGAWVSISAGIPVTTASQTSVKGMICWGERGLGREKPGCAPFSFPPCWPTEQKAKRHGAVGKEGVRGYPLHALCSPVMAGSG